MAKYGMSMCVLGMAEELKPDGIAVNALWPRTGLYGMVWYLVCSAENTALFSKHYHGYETQPPTQQVCAQNY